MYTKLLNLSAMGFKLDQIALVLSDLLNTSVVVSDDIFGKKSVKSIVIQGIF